MNDIYAALLLPKKHGYPLWLQDPDSGLPLAYRSVGVNIGDVGTITYDGGFDFLFNICHDANHPVNFFGVPDGFTPLPLKPEDVIKRPEMHDKGYYISNPRFSKERLREEEFGNALWVSVWQQHFFDSNLSVLGSGVPERFCSGFRFGCSGPSGAVLVLPEGGSRVDLRKQGLFFDYAAQHGIGWYQFVNGSLGRRVQNGSLYLVTGCDKNPAWGVASYSDPSSSGNPDVSLKFKAVELGKDGTTRAYSWDDYNSVAVRTGYQQVEPNRVDPDSSEPGTNPTFNQCAFIRGYRISVQPRLISMLLGNRVEVEDGINPLHKVKKDGVFSSFSSIFQNIFSTVSRSETSYPGAGNECVSVEYISDVSDVSSYSSDAWDLKFMANPN